MLIVRLFRLPVIDGNEIGPAVVPPNSIFEAEVPAIVPAVATIFPFKVSVFDVTDKAPDVNVAVPFTVVLLFKNTPPALLMVRLFKTVEVVGIS